MSYKLTYFDMAGRGEPIRFLLSYGGIEFEDNRLSKDEFKTVKSDMPFGQLPVLEYNGKIINQSFAICRYLGKQVKLTGNNDWEDLEIDASVDTLNDLFQKIVEGVKSNQGTFKEQFVKEEIVYYVKKLDEQIKRNGGYLAAGHLTWADLVFVSFMLEFINRTEKDIFVKYPNIEGLIRKVQDIPKIKQWLANHPKTE